MSMRRIVLNKKFPEEGTPKGIIVNNVDVDTYIDREKTAEIKLEVSEDIKDKRKSICHYTCKHNDLVKTGPAGKVINFSRDRMRKEYAVMQMPYKKMTERIIYTIAETNCPMSTKDISKRLEAKYNIFPIMTRIMQKIPHLFMKDDSCRPSMYCKRKDIVLDPEIEFNGDYAVLQYRNTLERRPTDAIKLSESKKETKPTEQFTAPLIGIPTKIVVEFIGGITVNVKWGGGV